MARAERQYPLIESLPVKEFERLRAASLDILDRGMFDNGSDLKFSYAHPLFWAPFTVVGDGGALRRQTE